MSSVAAEAIESENSEGMAGHESIEKKSKSEEKIETNFSLRSPEVRFLDFFFPLRCPALNRLTCIYTYVSLDRELVDVCRCSAPALLRFNRTMIIQFARFDLQKAQAYMHSICAWCCSTLARSDFAKLSDAVTVVLYNMMVSFHGSEVTLQAVSRCREMPRTDP